MSLPTCPSGCTTPLPLADFNDCAPVVNNSQIGYVYITTKGNPLTDWSSASEWDSRISNSSTLASAIRKLTVIGEFPEPTSTEKEISGGRKVLSPKEFQLLFDVDETNEYNYNFLRNIECNNGEYLMWFETRDGLLFGDTTGIEVTISGNQVISRTYEDHILFKYKSSWKSQYHPARIDSPVVHD